MRVLLILPALTEAKSPFFRPIKYALFPPLGLATLAAYLSPDDEATIIDEHVEHDVDVDSCRPESIDLVVIQTYITNAHRAYRLADEFRSRGCFVALGGLHATSLPDEAAPHADALFLGPGEHTFPAFLEVFRRDRSAARATFDSRQSRRTLHGVPLIRRDLIKRARYLVPNSIVVTRGCPHHCAFCYKDAFYEGGKSFYTQNVDDALAEIDRLPGRHLYFLDDHLFGDTRFATALFDSLKGAGRVFQGAATVDSILRGDLVERAVAAGLRSIFIGFESLSESVLKSANKRQNLERTGQRRRYEDAIRRLDSLGVSINASFVFGLDGDDPDVFDRTVRWASDQGITTATFHIATPYPGTAYHKSLESSGRIRHREWDLYDTRHVVFDPIGMTDRQLEDGYWHAYRSFYSLANITASVRAHASLPFGLKCGAYALAWKRLEPMWNILIRTGVVGAMRPIIESGLEAARPRALPRVTAAEPDAETTPLTITATSQPSGASPPGLTPTPDNRPHAWAAPL